MRCTLIHQDDPHKLGKRVKVALRTNDTAEAQIRRDIVLSAFHLAGLLVTIRCEPGDFVEIGEDGPGGGQPMDSDPGGNESTLASEMATPSNEAEKAAGDPVKAEAPPLSIEDRLAKLEAVHKAEVRRLNGELERLQIRLNRFRQAS